MRELRSLFLIYKPQGILKALWTILRIVILPYDKLDKIIPKKGIVLDIGCGNGGFTNYIVLGSKERKVTGIDFSKDRISQAVKSIRKRKNIKFIFGDVVKTNLPKANCYLMIDMLHHISFKNQDKIIRFISKRLDGNSLLIIKEVDSSNRVPFLFGHIIEKFLYQGQKKNGKGYFYLWDYRAKLFLASSIFPIQRKFLLLDQ